MDEMTEKMLSNEANGLPMDPGLAAIIEDHGEHIGRQVYEIQTETEKERMRLIGRLQEFASRQLVVGGIDPPSMIFKELIRMACDHDPVRIAEFDREIVRQQHDAIDRAEREMLPERALLEANNGEVIVSPGGVVIPTSQLPRAERRQMERDARRSGK